MLEDPTFFLTSTEARPTLIPRKCWIVERLWSDERKDYLLRVHIEPPITGMPLGINEEVVNEVVIATRHKDTSLFSTSDLPIYVYVCYLIHHKPRNTGKVSSKDLRIILIGEIYSSMEDAEAAICDENNRF